MDDLGPDVSTPSMKRRFWCANGHTHLPFVRIVRTISHIYPKCPPLPRINANLANKIQKWGKLTIHSILKCELSKFANTVIITIITTTLTIITIIIITTIPQPQARARRWRCQSPEVPPRASLACRLPRAGDCSQSGSWWWMVMMIGVSQTGSKTLKNKKQRVFWD